MALADEDECIVVSKAEMVLLMSVVLLAVVISVPPSNTSTP